MGCPLESQSSRHCFLGYFSPGEDYRHKAAAWSVGSLLYTVYEYKISRVSTLQVSHAHKRLKVGFVPLARAQCTGIC